MNYNGSSYADLSNTSTVSADEVIIGNLSLPNLDPNSIPYIDSSNNVLDRVLNDGQILIGQTNGPPLTSSLTGTTDEIIVTNGPGSITLSTPQPIATTSSPSFANVTTTNLYESTNGYTLIGPSTPATNSFNICSDNNLNGTNNSIIIGDNNLANIRPKAAFCNLGSAGAPFQTVYLTGDVHGLTYNRSADNIVSCSTSQTADNLVSFDSLQKVIKDTGISSLSGPWLPLTGGTMNGNIAMSTHNITNVGTLSGATNSRTADNIVSNTGTGVLDNIVSFTSDKVIKDSGITAASITGGPFLPLAGGTMSGNIGMSAHDITSVGKITTNTSVVNVGQTNTTAGINDIVYGASNTFGSVAGGSSTVCGNGNNLSGSTNGQSMIYGNGNNDSNASGGCFIFGFGNTNGTGARNILLGRNNTVTNGVNEAFVMGFNCTNSTSNSLLVGGTSQANIRAGSTICDLGTTSNKFKDVYASGNLIGAVKTSAVDSIVTGPATATGDNLCSYNSTTGKIIKDSGISSTNVVTGPASATDNNLCSFNLTTGKIIKDSGITSTNLVQNTAGATTAGQVATYSDTTGKLITNSSTPILGTPASGTLTNCTSLPISTGVSGLGTGVATMLGTFSSANIKTACTDETGSSLLVFNTNPNFIAPTIRTWPVNSSKLSMYDSVTYSNTNAINTFFGGTLVGSTTYPAATTGPGMVIKIRTCTQLNSWTGGGTLTISAGTLAAKVSLAVPVGLAAGNYFVTDFDIYIRAGNLWRGQGILWASGQAPVIADGNGTWTNSINQDFGVWIQFSVASAGNQVSPLSCNVQTLYQTL